MAAIHDMTTIPASDWTPHEEEAFQAITRRVKRATCNRTCEQECGCVCGAPESKPVRIETESLMTKFLRLLDIWVRLK
jgi:hypothetical protein